MLTSKQRSYLRKMANSIQPIFQIGKGGINDNLVVQVNDALEARELIKITVLDNCDEDVRTICNELSKKTDSDQVQVIGRKFVLYKQSEEEPSIILPS